jgi:hypothetical protein
LKLTSRSPATFCHVSQVEANIYHPQASLHKYCAEKNIHLTAYCPIGQPKPEVGSKVLKDEVLIGLGEKYGKPAAAVSTIEPDNLESSAMSRNEATVLTRIILDLFCVQVALSWLVQRGNWSAVPKSANPTRMAQNLEVCPASPASALLACRCSSCFNLFRSAQIFELEKADFEALSKVHEQPGKLMISCDYGSGDIMEKGEIFGWSLKDMGWEKLD